MTDIQDGDETYLYNYNFISVPSKVQTQGNNNHDSH